MQEQWGHLLRNDSVCNPNLALHGAWQLPGHPLPDDKLWLNLEIQH